MSALPPLVMCATCARYGCEPGCGCIDCGTMVARLRWDAISTLAANLAVAGGLAWSFQIGLESGDEEGFARGRGIAHLPQWHPNTWGHPAPNWSKP